MGQCHHRNPDPRRAASPPVTESQSTETGRQMARWMADLQDPWIACHENGLTAVLPKVYRLRKVDAARIPTKTEYSFKGL